ncbi:MAG: 50S ribosomal protein L4 [Planctomycetes bacterium]|nr:50S ribosomal protein L4 [Planctomycetota bacterium]
MKEIKVFNAAGDSTGVFSVDLEALGEGVSRSLLHRVVVSYEANLRQGSASTKTRGDRRGSGKKLWKQKGTGRARVGSIRSPLWKGGGVIFGPKPKDYRMKMSQKERALALRGAMQGKLNDDEVVVIEEMKLSEPKTKLVAGFLSKASVPQNVLFVSDENNADWLRASSNIQKANILPLKDLNALAVLKAEAIVIEKSALEKYVAEEGAQ